MLRLPDGTIVYKTDVYWTGDYSNVFGNGILETFIINELNTLHWDGYFIMPKCDGDISTEYAINYLTEHTRLTKTEASNLILLNKVIVGTVAYRSNPPLLKSLLLPQDDSIFLNGLTHYFPKAHLPSWESKIPKVFWRGACSGDFSPDRFLRKEVVEALLDHPSCDVKLIRKWHVRKTIPNAFFAPPKPVSHFLNYQYILIIDGNGISSSHSWVFASGSVPILIGNCHFWFESYLTPFVHYVPVDITLCDLHKTIDWLLQHPAESKRIAENAYRLAETVFSANHQQTHLQNELKNLIYK